MGSLLFLSVRSFDLNLNIPSCSSRTGSMKRAQSPSSTQGVSKKRQTRIIAVSSGRPANLSSRPTATRHTQIRHRDNGRPTQRRKINKPVEPPVPDDREELHPDDTINGWVDEPEQPACASASEPAKPKRKKSNLVCFIVISICYFNSQ